MRSDDENCSKPSQRAMTGRRANEGWGSLNAPVTPKHHMLCIFGEVEQVTCVSGQL